MLGELLDSRFMLPLYLPSDPRMLSAAPAKKYLFEYTRRPSTIPQVIPQVDPRSASRASTSGAMEWKCRSCKVRKVSIDALQWLDGFKPSSRWARPLELQLACDDEDAQSSPSLSDPEDLRINTDVPRVTSHSTPLTRKPSASARSRNRLSMGGDQLTPFASP